MKILISVIWFILISSCSAKYHLNRAIKKGAEIKVDTVYQYIYRTDTLYNENTHTFTVTKFVVDSIPYTVSKKIYIPMSRQERLMYKDSLSHIRKLYELETKRVKVEVKQVKIEQKTKRKTSPVSFLKNFTWILVIFFVAYFLIKLNKSL